MLYLVVFFSNVCDIYVCYMLNKITYLLDCSSFSAVQLFCILNLIYLLSVNTAWFLLRDADRHSVYLLRQRVWVAGWVGVCHSRYCIKTTKHMLKLFRPPGSTFIEAFGTPCACTQFQGNLFSRGVKYTGGGWRFSCDF